jgi:hypothetical protein
MTAPERRPFILKTIYMPNSPLQMAVTVALSNWDQSIKRTTETFNNLSDEELFHEIAPGKNRAVYLLGHLAAVHDRMLPVLGLGERQYPFLDEAFINAKDKAVANLPAVGELRSCWKKINEALEQKFRAMEPEGWLQRHTAVSEEDFAKEPHRNKLNVLLSRIGHLQYHLGQLVLLKK